MRRKQKIINLYHDKSIRSIKHVISIGNEEDLNQFWFYFDSEIKNDYILLYRFISLMYAFVSKLFEEDKDLFFELIIEQNDEFFYFTVWNNVVSKAMIHLLQENKQDFEYIYNHKRVTVKLSKKVLQKHNEIRENENNNRRNNLIAVLSKEKNIIQEPYTFLQAEDKEEILTLCEDMLDLMFQAKKIGFKNDVFIRLRSYLSVLSLHLTPYPQISNMVKLITEFSVLMNSNKDLFKDMSLDEMSLVEGFIHNLDRWANTLFVSGGADIYFMDSSLKADLQMIKMQILPLELEEEIDMDAIFNF